MAKIAAKHWYVVTTYSQRENKVKENLERRKISLNLEEYIFNILVAEQDVQVMKNGLPTGKTKKKNLYPGNVFVECIMTDEVWYFIRNTEDVTGIAGSAGGGQKPAPVSQEEIEPVLKRMGMIDESMYQHYNIGDYAKIIHGPYEGIKGEIVAIDKEKGEFTLEIIARGRVSRATADFSEIERIDEK